MPSTKEKKDRSEYDHRYYEANKEKILERKRTYYERHADAIKRKRKVRYYRQEFIRINGYDPLEGYNKKDG